MFKKADILLIVFFLTLAVGLFIWNARPAQGQMTAVVEQDGVEIARYSLTGRTGAETVVLGGEYQPVLLLEAGAVSFESSLCPGQECVRAGKLAKPGQAAACLPARISVRIEGGKASTDAITG